MTRILIIMPALNEEESLRATLKELREVVDGPDILVIDDGSTDATAEVASRAPARCRPSCRSRSASAAPSAWVCTTRSATATTAPS